MKRYIFLALLAFIGCEADERILPPSHNESLQGVAKLALVIPASIPSELVQRIEYKVTGSGIDEAITGTMTIADREAKAVISGIPAGSRRVFEVNSFCSEDIITYSGSGTGDVEYKKSIQVIITVSRKLGQLKLAGVLPKNTTRIEFTITASDIAAPIVKDVPIEPWTNSYLFTDIPTGTQRQVTILAYDKSKDNVTAEGRIITNVHHDITTQVDFTYSSGIGGVELIARFPEN